MKPQSYGDRFEQNVEKHFKSEHKDTSKWTRQFAIGS